MTDITLEVGGTGVPGPQGEPFTINAEGLLNTRATYDSEAKGFAFYATDTGDVYQKKSAAAADWSGPIPFKGERGDTGAVGESAYQAWLNAGNEGTEAQFVASLKGESGTDGKDAYQQWLDAGNSGTISDFLTAIEGEKGEKGDIGNTGGTGLSAYEVWQAVGNVGTEEEFLASLKGDKGDVGDTGKSALAFWQELGNVGDVDDMLASFKGDKGDIGYSTFQIWLNEGNVGTVQDFLEFMRGPRGYQGLKGDKGDRGDGLKIDAQGTTANRNAYDDEAEGFSYYATDTGTLYLKQSATSADWNAGSQIKGETGDAGADGVDGKSAYQLWLDAGNAGSEAQFIASLKGDTGDAGSDGKSAYQLWQAAGNDGTEAEYLASLKGDKGDGVKIDAQGTTAGRSAYDNEAEGFTYYDGDTGLLYFKLSGAAADWSAGASIKGEKGDTGNTGDTGATGDSAHQAWINAGNSGTEADFIASLKGDKGDTGNTGNTGDSAHQIWINAGNSGTEADFLAALKGDKGDQGDIGNTGNTGSSAHQHWIDEGNSGTVADFLTSLKGDKGDPGDLSQATADARYVLLTGGTVANLTSTTDLTVNGLTVGKGAGTGTGCVAIGEGALSSNSTGSDHIAIGKDALKLNTGSSNTIAIGTEALSKLTTLGGSNIAIGSFSMRDNASGTSNVAIGTSALLSNTEGDWNTAIGHQAGSGVTGNGNVLIGRRAGQNEAGSDKLHIANTNTKTLIEGDFANDWVKITGDLEVTNAPTAAGHVTRKDYVDGVAVPAGGTTGQVLSKTDDTDHNTQWIDPPAGGGGGGGQIILTSNPFFDGPQSYSAYEPKGMTYLYPTIVPYYFILSSSSSKAVPFGCRDDANNNYPGMRHTHYAYHLGGANAGSLILAQPIRDVRNRLENETITVSFYANITSGQNTNYEVMIVNADYLQITSTVLGGSEPTVYKQAITLSTTMQRYDVTFTLPATLNRHLIVGIRTPSTMASYKSVNFTCFAVAVGSDPVDFNAISHINSDPNFAWNGSYFNTMGRAITSTKLRIGFKELGLKLNTQTSSLLIRGIGYYTDEMYPFKSQGLKASAISAAVDGYVDITFGGATFTVDEFYAIGMDDRDDVLFVGNMF